MVTFAYTSPWNIFFGVYGLIIKRTKQILKIWPPHFTGRQKEIDCVTENFCAFFFNWYQTFIITRHCTSDLWHQTSTFWNKELNCWLQTLCQQLLERKDCMDCSPTWHLYQVNFFQFWHMSFGQSKLRPTCIDKWVTANTCLWKYPWIPKSH